MELKKKWEIFLIHHSHTDIGYTERQDKIIRYHCDFIKQAIDILDDIHKNGNKDYEGFVWQCENYWQVKTFYEQADEAYISAFEKYVKRGEIGLSGNYLNMTELTNYDILFSRLQKAKKYSEQITYPIVSGMTADINGFAWGYSQALYDNGIENLFSCIHPHHGMFPLYKKQIPFYWETPKGNKILVWNGEHYHFGNELHFTPHGSNSYLLHDEIAKQMNAGSIFNKSKEETEKREIENLYKRLERYLKNLEQEDYPCNFVPFMVSGAITDNAPPNVSIVERIQKLNRMLAGQVEIKMATLDQFFVHVKKNWKEIKTYKGDWNDWWADGVGSTPAIVKNFKDAQRKYNLCKKMDPNGSIGNPQLMDQAEENLTLYAEHTWGYSSSVSEPWETLVGDLELKKAAYAINGNTEIASNLDCILEKKGEVAIRANKPQRFKIINPHEFSIKTTTLLFVELWEYIDGLEFSQDIPIEVVVFKSGESLPVQVKRIPRAYQLEVLIELEEKEEIIVELRINKQVNDFTLLQYPYIGADRVADIVQPNVFEENTSCIETEYYKIIFDEEIGIQSIIDKKDGGNLIHSASKASLFSGIYEVTAIKDDPCEVRRKMGRNRKDSSTKRYYSTISNISIVENGDVYIAVKLEYKLEGTGFYTVFLKIYKELPRIDATVRIHKYSVQEPENLYIALPITGGEEEVKYIDKTGCLIRPGIDQLPGSNQEFYLIQNGLVIENNKKNIVLAIKDCPLITLGDLKASPIHLCNGDNIELNKEIVYSWAMNNYWETNFKVDLGGFYEFAYSIQSIDKTKAEEAMKICEAMNEGLISFYI